MDTTVLDVDTSRDRIVDLTDDVRAFCRTRGDGLVNVFAPHATAGIAIIETGARSDDDLVDALERLLPRDDRYRHAHGSPGHGADHVLPGDRRAVGRRCRCKTASRCSACGRAWCSSTSTATTRAGNVRLSFVAG